MAANANDIFDEAVAEIDRKMDDLARAREHIVNARDRVWNKTNTAAPTGKKRGRKPRKGLPAQTDAVQ